MIPSTLPPPDDIARVLGRLTGWNDLDRYDIRLRQVGNRLSVKVVLLAGDQMDLPDETAISGLLQLDTGASIGIPFRPVGPPGTFEAKLTLPQLDNATQGIFVVSQTGALPQAIPINIAGSPARDASMGAGEIFDFGLNGDVLKEIRDATGGIDLAVTAPDVGRIASVVRYVYLYPWMILAALFLLVGAVWFQGRRE